MVGVTSCEQRVLHTTVLLGLPISREHSSEAELPNSLQSRFAVDPPMLNNIKQH